MQRAGVQRALFKRNSDATRLAGQDGYLDSECIEKLCKSSQAQVATLLYRRKITPGNSCLFGEAVGTPTLQLPQPPDAGVQKHCLNVTNYLKKCKEFSILYRTSDSPHCSVYVLD